MKILLRLAVILSFLISAAAPVLASGHIRPTAGLLSEVRIDPLAVKLTDGRVLVVGGFTLSPTGGFAQSQTAEIYDPTTDTFSLTPGRPVAGRGFFTATRLLDGRVLLVGGTTDGVLLGSAELFDPATGTFTATAGSMQSPRFNHAAVLLQDGQVLVAGGMAGFGADTAELFDPATGMFTATGNLNQPRERPVMTLLANGSVLMSGGSSTGTAVYRPDPGAFFGNATYSGIGSSATRLPDGRILIAGGRDEFNVPVATAQLLDPVTMTTSPAGTLNRTSHSAVDLANGMVLIDGGYAPWGPEGGTEVWQEGLFLSYEATAVSRVTPVLTRLDDGRILILGGDDTAELLTAPVPPVVDAGADQTITANAYASSAVTLSASATPGEPDAGPLAYQWSEGGTPLSTASTVSLTLSVGIHAFMLEVTDARGFRSRDSVTVFVQLPSGGAGTPGPAGPAGAAGAVGATGATGTTGPQGPQGLQGDPGPQGPLGPSGPAGPQGIAGVAGIAPSGTVVFVMPGDPAPANYTLIATFKQEMDLTPNRRGGNREVTVRVFRKN